jgi:ribokinase
MPAPRIAVIGSVNIDMVVKASRLPAPGETIVGGQFLMAGGGKGANQAVAAARLGARVTLLAKVGRDVFGDEAIENFHREGIATDHILRDPQNATGVALILVDEKGENLISVASGANYTITPEDIDNAADCIHSSDLLILQLEIPIESVQRAAQIAAEANVPVILNPAPAMPLSNDLLQLVTYLTPNESEAQRLSGVEVRDEASAQQAAERLMFVGARHVIITLGAKGAQWTSAAGTMLIPSVAITAVDTTAAGDAFNGGLAWAIGSGMPLEQAIRHACLAGAISATRLGAQPSLPTKDELDRFINSQTNA